MGLKCDRGGVLASKSSGAPVNVCSHGRWSPTSRDFGARSSSVFSTKRPTSSLPLSLSLHPPGRNHHHLPGPPPTLSSPPACNTTLLSPGCALINRASTAPPNWFVISDPSVSVLTTVLCSAALCARGLQQKSERNIKAAEKDKDREWEGGRKGYRQADRERNTPLSSSTPPDLVHLDGRDTSSCVSADRDPEHAASGSLHSQLYFSPLLC